MDTAKSQNLEELSSPINPIDFVKRFKKKFERWGNIATKELQETWELNCLAMNAAIKTQDKVIKYVVSAPTGSAKTENIITYCAMLPEDVTVLIGTNLTEEANRIAKSINEEAKKELACAYHASTSLTYKEAAEFRIVVTTHSFYKRNQAGTQKWDIVGRNRDLIIIDEALEMMTEISVKSSDIRRAINLFSHLFSHCEKPPKELVRLQEDYDKLVSSGKGTRLISSDVMIPILNKSGKRTFIKSLQLPYRYFLFLNMLEDNDAIKFNQILTGINDESSNEIIKNKIIETLTILNSLKSRQVYITANRGEYSYNKVVISDLRKTIVCFDATADVNYTYELRANYHQDIVKIPKVKNVRDYSNVTLHIALGQTGKTSKLIQQAHCIMENITLGEKTLVVTHKQNESLFQELAIDEYADKIISVAHWGSLTGLNDWQDFDTCVIVGLNHKPKSYSQNRAIANTDEETAFGEEQQTINNVIADTDLAAEIIQAMNRIRIRKVTDKNGGCMSGDIYLILPLQSSDKLLKLIKAQMPNIKITDWELPDTIVLRERKGHLASVINYLLTTMKVGDSIHIAEPKEKMGINKESYRSVLGKTKERAIEFHSTLFAYGFEIVEKTERDKRGRSRKDPTPYFYRFTENE